MEQGRWERLHQLPDGQAAVRELRPGVIDGEKMPFKDWERATPSKTACPLRSWQSAGSTRSATGR
jgi:hypothetical protein